jgi:hypothetical protein
VQIITENDNLPETADLRREKALRTTIGKNLEDGFYRPITQNRNLRKLPT